MVRQTRHTFYTDPSPVSLIPTGFKTTTYYDIIDEFRIHQFMRHDLHVFIVAQMCLFTVWTNTEYRDESFAHAKIVCDKIGAQSKCNQPFGT